MHWEASTKCNLNWSGDDMIHTTKLHLKGGREWITG